MLAAFKSLLKWLVYAGLIAFAGGLMLLGKADILLVERVSLRINDAAIPLLELLSRPIDAVAGGLARIATWTNLAEENARLREDRDRLMRWQAVAQRLEAKTPSCGGSSTWPRNPQRASSRRGSWPILPAPSPTVCC